MTFTTLVSAKSTLDENKATGSLTLTKYETDSEKTISVSDAEFTAYKIAEITSYGTFKAVDAYKNVSVTVGDSSDTKTYALNELMKQDDFSTDKTAGGFTFTSTRILEEMIPALQSVAQDETNPQAGIKSKEVRDAKNKGTGEYKFTDLPLGVYLVVETKAPQGYVVSSQSFLASVPEWDNEKNNWNYDVTASPKNATTSPDKKIVKNDATVKEDTVKIGDIVNYKVTAKLPNYGDVLPISWIKSEYYPTEQSFNKKLTEIKYNFIDTMSEGLTFSNNMTVNIDGVTDALVPDTDYVLTSETMFDKSTKVSVQFNWANINKYQGKIITFTYSAVVNEKALLGSANTNTAKVQYNRDPRITEDPTDSKPSGTKVYTYGMNLTKLFNNARATDNIDASKVEFSLKLGEEKQWFITSESGKYFAYSAAMSNLTTPAEEGRKVTINDVEYTITRKLNPSKKGTLLVDGLNIGTYILTEEESVKGFSKLASDVTIIVTADKDANNDLTGKVAAKVGDKHLDTATDNIGKFLFSVNNVSKQFDLPLTGGMGILMFTVGGGVIIAAAIIIFSQLRKKKKTTEK